MDAQKAAEDFVAKLRDIYRHASGSPLVNVILDGENAWEFYPNNASDFFHALYAAIEKEPWIETITMKEAAKHPDVPESELEHLVPGSWINANFAIWVGQAEKNRAWELISEVQELFYSKSASLDEATRIKVEKELMITQGSDWYWWFGDTHYTALKGEFDSLFRRHLINACRLMGEEPFESILSPIVTGEVKQVHTPPKNTITINLDGRSSSFFEWMGAGEFNLEKMGTAMDSSTPYAKRFLYGFDGKSFSFALMGDFVKLGPDASISIMLGGEVYLDVPLANRQSDEISIARGDNFLEFSIPESAITTRQFDLKLRLHRQGEMLQDIPFHGGMGLEKAHTYPDHWFI